MRGHSGRTGTAEGPCTWAGTGWETLREVRDAFGDPRKGPGWVVRPLGRSGTGQGPSGRSGMDQGTLWEVRTGLGPMGRSGTGRETLGEFQDESWDPPGGSGWVTGHKRRTQTGRGTLLEDRDGSREPRGGPGWVHWIHGEVWDGSGDPRGSQGRVGGHSGRSEMGRLTLV